MARKTMKAAALAAILGTVFGFGGCLSGGLVQRALWTAAGYTGLEFLLDNPDVLDLFDGDPAVAG
jgi:hypothetical protein